MYAFQNDFHHEKGHILFLNSGISALGHQMPRLVVININPICDVDLYFPDPKPPVY